uniref:RNase H type-1 domain-containing protein n=1 Tax=Oryza brachyantha TaxID=4533 RepID=J3LF08_ORYBR
MLRVQRPDLGLLRLRSSALACCLGGDGGARQNHRVNSSLSARTWRKPETGWMKLNFDGSCKHLARAASIGGVYRDHEGAFVLGYAERIGTATSSAAELAALRRGLELAARNGWWRVWVEGDSKAVIDAVCNRAKVRPSEDLRQYREIAALLPLFDGVAASHVFRGGNKVAHGFAKLGHKAARPRVWHATPPEEVLRFLRQDADQQW